MKRPVNSKYYEFDTTNPNQGYRGCDCVVRSISLAMNKSWEHIFDDLCAIGRKLHRMPNDDKVFEKYLKDNGWICLGQPRKSDNSKYTGKEFIVAYESQNHNTSIIANIASGHLSCIIDNKFHDIWDPSDYCIGKIWIKP